MSKNKEYTIGVDVGGTKMNAVLMHEGKVLEDFLLATPKDSVDHFMVMMKALVEPFFERAEKDKAEIKGVGLGIAGVVNYAETKMLKSPNIPIINGVEIPKEFEKMVGVPVKMNNDVDCFIRAEAVMGAAKNYTNAYGIIVGTGIGGSWYLKDEVYRGSHGGAGEPGEMIIDFDNGITLEGAYHKLTQNNPASLAEEAYRGDILAEKTFQELGRYLGVALANIVNLINPTVFVIGGGAVNSSDLFLKEMKSAMKENIFSTDAKEVKILKSKIGKHAGAIGAALLF